MGRPAEVGAPGRQKGSRASKGGERRAVDERWLKTFLTAAQLGSFSRAARVLYVTQSTVTSRIAELEKELGRPLFVREARGVTLTEAGRAFLRYAQRSLAALEEGRAAVAGAVEGDQGQLRVMACHLPAAVDLPHLLKMAALDNGAGLGDAPMPIHIQTAPSKKIYRTLLQGEADVGLVNVRFRHPELESRIVAERPMTLVAAGTAGGGGEGPLFFLEEELEDALQAQTVAHQLGFSPGVCMGISDMAALKSMVLHGLGMALIPREAVAAELESGAVREMEVQEAELLPKQITCLLVRREPIRAWRLRDRFLDAVEAYYGAMGRG